MASMNILPDKHLFMITSCINTNIGIFNSEQRFKQTIETIDSIRKYSPNSLIFLADNSSEELKEHQYKILAENSNLLAIMSRDKDCLKFNSIGNKSAADCIITLKMIEVLLFNPEGMKLIHQSKRLYKISGRYHLNENFKEENFDHYGKIVVKYFDTWRDNKNIGGLYLTRLFGFCPSLIRYVHQKLAQSVDTIFQDQVDIEHAIYKNLDKDLIVTIPTLGLTGKVAPNGHLHID